MDVSALTRAQDIEQIDLPLGLLGQSACPETNHSLTAVAAGELAMREVPTSMRTMFVYSGAILLAASLGA